MARLQTKEARLNLQNAQFQSLLNKGYNRENYKDIIIFSNTESLHIQIFKGTSTNPIENIICRSLESMTIKADKYKKSADYREERKAKEKANPMMSTHANCSKAIKAELQEAFKGVKFSVKSDSFSGGDSVHINWTDGPTNEQVREITSKYQQGRFDGMTDMYEYTNTNPNLPQVKYVSERRDYSEGVEELLKEEFKKHFSQSNLSEWEYERMINDQSYRLLAKTPIPTGAKVLGLETTEKESGSYDEVVRVKFELPNQPEKETPNFEAVEVPAGQIQIIDYSEKAIAVIGETKPIKDKLKELGGKFNFRLSCGAGWIFPKTKLSEIEALFS